MCDLEKRWMRQVDIAPAQVEMRMNPSPSRRMAGLKPALVRLMSTTPAKPSTQPSTLRPVRRSERNSSAAKRMAMKLALPSMMELVTPDAFESPW